MTPRYPIYIPSKGRADIGLTAQSFLRDGVPFYLVVEPQEYEQYAQHFDPAHLLTLPFSNVGSVIPARNWIKEHATQAGFERHWQFDDNILKFGRRYKSNRVPCDSGVAIQVAEDFVDRYENIAIAGFQYNFFLLPKDYHPPFRVNVHVYSASLILNALPHQWRGKYNEDTDLCLQVLADGWCTVLFNAFFVYKMRTMTVKGGNTAELYHGDGRLKMARALERQWPGVVTVNRRFNRPQHIIKKAWQAFDTPLKLKPGIDLSALPPVDEYGVKITQQTEIIQSTHVKSLMQDFNQK